MKYGNQGDYERSLTMSVKDMIIKEIDKLPENKLAEVYDFIKFLETKQERELLQQSSESLSERSFEKIWVNEEDSVYDKL